MSTAITHHDPPDQLMTIDEVASLLNQSPWTLYKNYKALGIPFIKINGVVRFRSESVQQWLYEREQIGTVAL